MQRHLACFMAAPASVMRERPESRTPFPSPLPRDPDLNGRPAAATVAITLRPGFDVASAVALEILTIAPPEWPSLVEEGCTKEQHEAMSKWTSEQVRRLAPAPLRRMVIEELGIYITRARMASVSSTQYETDRSRAAMKKSAEQSQRDAAMRQHVRDLAVSPIKTEVPDAQDPEH